MITSENLIARIPYDALLATLPAVSADKTRGYPTGVYLDGYRGCIVATDGHILIACRVDKIEGTSLQQSVAEILAFDRRALSALKLGKGEQLDFVGVYRHRDGETDALLTRRENDKGWAPSTVESAKVHRIDRVFPDWCRAVPRGALGKWYPMAYAVDLKLLARTQAALEWLADDDVAAARLICEHRNGNGPALVLPQSTPVREGVIVVMGVRTDIKTDSSNNLVLNVPDVVNIIAPNT